MGFLIALLMSLAGQANAAWPADSYTPNYHFVVPSTGTYLWGSKLNADIVQQDTVTAAIALSTGAQAAQIASLSSVKVSSWTCPAGFVAQSGYYDHVICVSSIGGINNGAGLPLTNAVMGFYSATCPPGWVACDGTNCNGMPDPRGLFFRAAGTNGSLMAGATHYAAIFGAMQTDQMQGHRHQVASQSGNDGPNPAPPWPAAGGYAGGNAYIVGEIDSNLFGPITTSSQIVDAGNGTPRTGYETRPANLALTYCMAGPNLSVIISTITGGRSGALAVWTSSSTLGNVDLMQDSPTSLTTTSTFTAAALNSISTMTVGGLTDFGAKTETQIATLACPALPCRVVSSVTGWIYHAYGTLAGNWRTPMGIGP